MSTITDRVTAIIVKNLLVEKSEITTEAHFVNDLGADSIDLVELIMEFENEFNVAIPDEAAEGIKTVGDAIKYLEENV
jgi:acyl carrier protein